MIFVPHLCHSSSQHPSNQLRRKVWGHHVHLHTPTQIDGQGERGVEMGAAGEDADRGKAQNLSCSQTVLSVQILSVLVHYKKSKIIPLIIKSSIVCYTYACRRMIKSQQDK